MTEQVQEQFSDSSHATEARMGFFEKTLYRQLDLSDQGFLKLESPSGKNTFGSDKKHGLQADLRIHRNEFFRKACLGGSLGVADSYAVGDWDTTDLVTFFRFFLQNQKVMDGMESGWATLLNKFARWAYLFSQKNTREINTFFTQAKI